jgi:hypothetical protein
MSDTPTTPDAPEPEATATFSVEGLSDTEVYSAYDSARARGQELAARSDRTAEENAELTELASRVQVIGDRITEIESTAAATQSAVDVFGALPARTAPVVTPAQTQEAHSAPAVEPVTASASKETAPVPSVAQMDAQPPVQADPAARHADTFGISLLPDAAGALRRQAGDSTDLREVGQAVEKLFSQFGQASRGVKADRAVAQFTRTRDNRLVLPGTKNGDLEVINFARDERRLDGGSLMSAWEKNAAAGGKGPNALTAAAGWCAPSENRYDLCSLWSMDGMLDLPTTTAPRGGINYTRSVTWAEINAASVTSFTKLTEAQVIAGTPKNCTQLPCPTFIDRRLDVAVTCITGSFLQSVGYPEVVSTWTDGLLTKHAHNVNKDVIAQIVAQAGASLVIPAQGADNSAVSSVLAAVDLAAEDMRYGQYMSFNTTFEVVLPHWVLVQWRADIARKNAWHTDPYALANATIMNWFAVRGIRPQFVYDWQDAQSGLAGGPGDITAPITPITALPVTVDFLLYPAGAIVLARQDVVTLTNVYDSTNLTQNLYTALFTEEGYAPIFPCGDVRLYTTSTCPSGATAAQVDTACPVVP